MAPEQRRDRPYHNPSSACPEGTAVRNRVVQTDRASRSSYHFASGRTVPAFRGGFAISGDDEIMPTVTSQGLFDSLARSLRDRPDLQIALTAHVRSMSGYNTLFAFQQSDTEEDKKQAVWRWCLGALVNNCVPDPTVPRLREPLPDEAIETV